MNFKSLLLGNHSSKQILAKNTFWLGMIEGFSKIIMFVVTVSVVRYLGPIGFGAYNFAFSVSSILMIFGDLGVTTILTRDIAKSKEKASEYLANVAGIKMICFGIVMLLAWLSFPFLGGNKVYFWLIILATAYNIAQQFMSLMMAVMIAYEKMEYVFLARVSYYLGILATALIATKFNFKVEVLVAGYLSISLVAAALAVWLCGKLNVVIGLKYNKKVWKEVLAEATPMFGFLACSQIYASVDSILISKFFGNEKLGYYQSAYKILYAFQSINIINTATFPRISNLIHQKNQEALAKLTKWMVIGSLIVFIPLALVISVFSAKIVTVIYGTKYLLAAPILTALIWTGVINYFRVMITNFLVAKKQQRIIFYAMLIGMMVNIGLNLIFMPKVGFEFAAKSLLISETVILILALMMRK
ncbi:MAG TPA: flippase [Candidatus Woesebacteria bacterium]|nr:flippase [Candidatus Woesebacteria bacterium]